MNFAFWYKICRKTLDIGSLKSDMYIYHVCFGNKVRCNLESILKKSEKYFHPLKLLIILGSFTYLIRHLFERQSERRGGRQKACRFSTLIHLTKSFNSQDRARLKLGARNFTQDSCISNSGPCATDTIALAVSWVIQSKGLSLHPNMRYQHYKWWLTWLQHYVVPFLSSLIGNCMNHTSLFCFQFPNQMDF